MAHRNFFSFCTALHRGKCAALASGGTRKGQRSRGILWGYLWDFPQRNGEHSSQLGARSDGQKVGNCLFSKKLIPVLPLLVGRFQQTLHQTVANEKWCTFDYSAGTNNRQEGTLLMQHPFCHSCPCAQKHHLHLTKGPVPASTLLSPCHMCGSDACMLVCAGVALVTLTW